MLALNSTFAFQRKYRLLLSKASASFLAIYAANAFSLDRSTFLPDCAGSNYLIFKYGYASSSWCQISIFAVCPADEEK